MIIIKNGERTIYHPLNPVLNLVNPRLSLEDNAAGSLTFTVYPENGNYDSIRKLFPIISVLRNEKIIFKGRVITDKKDFYNGKAVEAEGKLAFFNDSYLEPFEFKGSPEELFRMFVENHNAQVKDWQQMKVGVVTVKDNNDYIVRGSEKIMNTWNALKEKCFQSTLGGHIRIRYESDGDYVDWLADYEKVSSQGIAFARNMISLSQETDASETYTAIRPVGAEVEGVRVDISSVNGGSTYLINDEKALEYGVIFAPETESVWEDVTLPENLMKKASDRLYGSMGALSETYEINAVDLNLTDGEIEALDICEYVPVDSRPHGISGNYLLNRAEIAIASPQDSVFYLGASRRVLSDRLGAGTSNNEKIPQKVSSFENDARYVSEEKAEELLTEYSKTEEVRKLVNFAVETIPVGPEGASAYEIAVRNGYEGTEEEWSESLKGEKGDPVKIEIGKVITGRAGTEAKVEDVGTEGHMILDFTIPQGEKGENGSNGGYDIIGTLVEIKGLQNSGKLADALIVKELSGQIPFRFGVDSDGRYGYYKDGADTVTPFKTGDGGGLERLIFTVPYDIAERYFTFPTLNGNTYLPDTVGYWQSIYYMMLPPERIISKSFSVLALTVQTG